MATQPANAFEEYWVQQAIAASLQEPSASAGAGADDASAAAAAAAAASTGGDAGLGAWYPVPPSPGLPGLGFPDAEDEALQLALAAGAADTLGSVGGDRRRQEDADLERALRESVDTGEAIVARRLMGPEGPFFPAGLLNSGNSCFWNALVQALFAATPIFRGALFKLDLPVDRGEPTGPLAVLCRLRDLFAEMDMGLAGAIDAGELYRLIFQRAEEADVSEQMQRLFELASSGPGMLKAVCQELFSGDLYERLKGGTTRRVPLDLCQLDLCVTDSVGASLEQLLEEHTQDVQGSITGRSYRLPPVLWVNLDRFVYDREAKRGRKRQVRLAFPEVLNVWMLVPPEESWVQELRASASRRQRVAAALAANRAEVARRSAQAMQGDAEDEMFRLVEEQEAMAAELAKLDDEMAQRGAEQELLYRLQAVIVHRGRVDTGHYYAYVRSPMLGSSAWVCLNDAGVSLCSAEEMHRMCEGEQGAEAAAPGAPAAEEAAKADTSPQALRQQEPLPGADAELPAHALPEHGGEGGTGAAAAGGDSAASVSYAGQLSQKRTFWNSMGQMLGCLAQKGGADMAVADQDEHLPGPQETYPCPAAGLPTQTGPAVEPQREALSPGGAPSPAASAGAASQRSQPPPQEDFTAARCLVYARSRVGDDLGALLTEVRQRVAPALQERIDAKNIDFLRESARKVAEDFVACMRYLTAAPADSGADAPRDALKETLANARTIRNSGGMSRVRMYLLKACWRLHVPWLPEELCPVATPPDFRMHYGGTAKRMLLDALIQMGQHDMASLITAGTADSDAFVPREAEVWLSAHGY